MIDGRQADAIKVGDKFVLKCSYEGQANELFMINWTSPIHVVRDVCSMFYNYTHHLYMKKIKLSAKANYLEHASTKELTENVGLW